MTSTASSESLKVFLSYSRRDMEIADRMVSALETAGFSVTIDRRDLPYGEEWQKELADFIRASDTVVWLVSAHSVASRWCNWELGEVQRLNKRLIPVAVGVVAPEELPEALGRIHVLPAEGLFDFDQHLSALTQALQNHRGWLKEHTRLADRARQWAERTRPAAMLLRGVALKDAQIWLDVKPPSVPAPSEDVLELLLASRRAEGRRQRLTVIGSLALAVFAIGLAAFAFVQRNDAVNQGRIASANEARANRERDAALTTQSRFLASLADGQIEAGDYGSALALAIEAMPDSYRPRPLVPEAEEVLAASANMVREKLVFDGHRTNIRSAAYSSDGRLVVTAASDGLALIWDAQTAQIMAELPHGGGTVFMLPASFAPDGKTVLTAAGRGAFLWRWETKDPYATLAHDAQVTSASLSPDGSRVLTTSDDKVARIWNAADGKVLHVLRGHGDAVQHGAFSPDGRLVVTGSNDNTARVWNALNGSLVVTLQGHRGAILSVAFARDGSRIVTSSSLDRTAHVWDVRGRRIATLSGHQDQVWQAAFSPDGRRVVTAGSDRTARVWDAEKGTELFVLGNHTASVSSATFSPDGSRIATVDIHAMRLWDAATGEQVEILRGHESATSAVFSQDGRVLLSVGRTTARMWDVVGADILRGHAADVTAAAYAPGGQRIATGAEDGTAAVWDVTSGKRLLTLVKQAGAINTIAWSPDGARIVTASSRGPTVIWDAARGNRVLALPTAPAAYFSPDGKHVLTPTGGIAQIWDATSGREVRKLGDPDYSAGGAFAVYSPDGTRILTPSSDHRSTRVWDLGTGKVTLTLEQEDFVAAAAFSQDGASIVTVGGHSGFVWDAATGEKKTELQWQARQLRRATMHMPDFKWVAFSPDGHEIFTAAGLGVPQSWDAHDGRERVPPGGGRESSPFGALSPDGTRFIGRWKNHTARSWRIFESTYDLVDFAKKAKPRELTEDQRKWFFLD